MDLLQLDLAALLHLELEFTELFVLELERRTGPAVLDGDTEWAQVVQWAVMATIQAWEFGLDSGNITSATGDNPALARFLGEEGFDPGLGLPSDFAVQVVSQVGNYEEIYERHLEPLGLPLHGSVNDLWTHGGLMYVPPYR